MLQNKVLICPLNWGLGHATRIVPIIRKLVKHNFEVLIAAGGDSYIYLKMEFPELKFIYFNSYTVRYSKFESQILKMSLLVPSILLWTIKEHFMLKNIIKKNNIDIVISDNRFGLWNKATYNVFITHQLNLKFPKTLNFMEPAYRYIANSYIGKYDECWIPDFKGENNLSGELSHGENELSNKYFVGPLSRFKINDHAKKDELFDVLFILSGPEPQRSIFEKIIYLQTQHSNLKLAIVRGTLTKSLNAFNFSVFNMLNTNELISLIQKSKLVICRSGYSSVMDLVALNKKAVLVPTPGQTEQEYLAKYLMQQGLFYSENQKEFSLQKAIKNAFEFPVLQIKETEELEERIINLKEGYNN